MSYCLSSLGALPETIVWDREGAIHDGHGNASEDFAAVSHPEFDGLWCGLPVQQVALRLGIVAKNAKAPLEAPI